MNATSSDYENVSTAVWHSLLCVQVPCYVFDSDGKKHDLSPLIKVTDGYLVDDGDDSIDFYINICRSLSECLIG